MELQAGVNIRIENLLYAWRAGWLEGWRPSGSVSRAAAGAVGGDGSKDPSL